MKAWLVVLGILGLTGAADADGIADARARVMARVRQGPAHTMVLSPEGRWVAVFNRRARDWVAGPLDGAHAAAIGQELAPRLRIELTPRGLVQAAVRDPGAGSDDTNYDAVWVRDAVWAYYALAEDPARALDARRLLLALWDYFASSAQVRRYRAVIADPRRALDQMAMPHIRFDGRARDLGDVKAGGKPEVWNHRQVDAHGLFYTALGEAVRAGGVTIADLTRERSEPLRLYPLFLERIDFTRYEDAGAWEELPRRNTSSIGLATRSLEVWSGLRQGDFVARALRRAHRDERAAWEPGRLDAQVAAGLARVRRQLTLGGESPDYDPVDPHYRRADAALLALVAPSPLAGLTESELRHAVGIVTGLVRPFGVLRYENDSYQGGNFWIRPAATATGPTGDTSSLEAFLARLRQLEPATEAQWFFDSWLALAYLHLAQITRDPRLAQADRNEARVHVRRALGQLTGADALAADGKPVRALEPPESVNTVVDGAARHALPSPITPLNWARATLSMALARLARSH